MALPGETPILEMRGISKRFPGVQALAGVDFRLFPGEVHAVMGQNGAGKSTLIKVLTGVHRADAGTILLGGTPIAPKSPQDAQRLGISTVYQEVNLCPNLSVAENIFLGRSDAGTYRMNWREIRRKAEALLAGELNLHIDVTATLAEYSIALQQLIAIARALAQQARILILDEPTSSLAEDEVNLLFSVIHRLKRQGMAVLFITHFLDQTFEISDRITVLRNGERVGEYAASALSRIELVTKMVGRELAEGPSARERSASGARAAGPLFLEARGLGRRGSVQGVDLSVRQAEVVGMGGLLGSGRTETARLLFGLDRADRGTVRVEERARGIRSPLDAIQAGIGFCPEDRKLEGIVGDLSLRENIVLALQAKRGSFRTLTRRGQDEIVQGYVKLLGIKAADAEVPISKLSGGNQQKALLARWLATDPRMLILDEPTAALTDAEAEILFAILDRLRARGVGMVYISHKLDEVFRLADRITVLRDGRTVSTDPARELDKGHVIACMVGREVTDLFPTAARTPEEIVFEARHVTVGDPNVPGKLLVDDVSFHVRRGEVLGIAGLVGAGRSDLLMGLFGGHEGRVRGEVFVEGTPLNVRNPSDAIARGIGFVTEDRKRFGLLLDQSLVMNATLAMLPLSGRILTDFDEETAAGERSLRELRVKTPSVFAEAMTLSGGNQQKVVLAKWLLTRPKVLFLDEPTRGIDVGAKQEIYLEINRLAARGLAIVLVSSELPEVLALSDRVLVLHEGRKTGEFPRAEATPEAVMACATGQTRAA